MRQIIQYFTDDDLYKLTMCCAVIDNFPRAHVCYQFVDRDDTVYPEGFAREVEHQIALLESVIITDEEIRFLRRKCNYLPEWFLTYLRGFRFSRDWVKVWQSEEGHLHIEFEGLWADTILLEVKVLAIVSELFYLFNEQAQGFDYQELYDKTYHKAERLLEAGCVFSDFGTRRRASLVAEDTAVRAMKDCYESRKWKGRFVGTSNIHLAMKYDLMPVGTMAHEFICATVVCSVRKWRITWLWKHGVRPIVVHLELIFTILSVGISSLITSQRTLPTSSKGSVLTLETTLSSWKRSLISINPSALTPVTSRCCSPMRWTLTVR